MSNIDLLEWLNRNSFRAYPITEHTSRISINTGIQIPDEVLVDAFVGADLDGGQVYVSAVAFTKQIVTVVLGSKTTTLGTATAVLGVHPPYSRLPLQSASGDVVGSVTFGTILNTETRSDFLDLAGTHHLSPDHFLETHCVLDLGAAPVETMSVPGRPGVSGEVEIITNDQLTVTASEQYGETFLVFDLVNPSGFLPDCERPRTVCDCPSNPIRMINGIEGPDITIELVDDLGEIVNLPGLIQLLVTRTSRQICTGEQLPDQYGRLPLPFELDCPPVTDYGTDPGPACS